jgi:hypothetical protein
VGKTCPIGRGSEGRPITKHCVAGLRHTVTVVWSLLSALRSAAPASRSHAHGRRSRTTCLRHAHAHRTAPPRQVGDRFACVRPGSGDESRDRDMGLNSTHAYGPARPSCRHLRPACAVQQDKGADLITIRLCIMRTYMYTTYATHSSMHGYVREGARSIYIPVRVHSSGAWTTYGAGPDFSYRIRHCRSGSTSPCGYSIVVIF